MRTGQRSYENKKTILLVRGSRLGGSEERTLHSFHSPAQEVLVRDFLTQGNWHIVFGHSEVEEPGLTSGPGCLHAWGPSKGEVGGAAPLLPTLQFLLR